ncbi:MAG: CDP-alcohol phosphatidyltransferase family protein [Blastocatellia bacterium]|nr:CDP-alcohol phosphatidyltransferase family protein [Blastocatellia bacterium]
MKPSSFKDADRKQESLLAPFEKRILLWLASKMPTFVNADHLSLLGLVAMLMAGIFYYFSRVEPFYLHLVNLSLALNWFGDSLDGTIARYRNKLRPKYGFYVDHMIDTFGTLFMIIGLAMSGYMSERIALAILIVYFMLSINSYLAAYSIGTFSISFWKFSPTELRILLAVGNLFLMRNPYSTILGKKYLLYDVGGLVGIIGMSLMLLVSTIRNTQILYRSERV